MLMTFPYAWQTKPTYDTLPKYRSNFKKGIGTKWWYKCYSETTGTYHLTIEKVIMLLLYSILDNGGLYLVPPVYRVILLLLLFFLELFLSIVSNLPMKHLHMSLKRLRWFTSSTHDTFAWVICQQQMGHK